MNTTTLAVLGSLLVTGATVTTSASAQYSDDALRIGLVTDMSGLYSDLDGAGGVEALKMAIEDQGGQINGKKIELFFFDHQNRADLAANKTREWFDNDGLDLVINGVNSATGLSMAQVAAEKKKVYISTGSGTPKLTNEACNPYTMNYVHDTISLARVTGNAVVDEGGKNWFFLTADYAFGHSLEKDNGEVVKARGGKVMGSVKHPLGTSDFSSFLLQAQSSGAEILGLANAGGDLNSAIRAANEFGVTQTMKLAALMMFISDVHALGLQATKGMYLASAWYWDMNDKSRAWSKRYYGRTNRMPTVLQAGDYSAATHYLNAVKAVGTDDPEKVIAKMKATKINDMFATNGVIRPDGRMVHDMYLAQVKAPSESKYPWDYYKILQTIPGEKAYNTREESQCPLWK
ncbi:MAG TPA: ABC transporter substrate-binding protein [Burkholderiaceae bacterium]|nr:ABC transporter substrate-binding protein [Burkholderiaceae bacterium]